ncbi:MAG TPA: PAS domain S-box protein, partial [Cyanophyceae cyanobacterium]
ASCTPPDGTSPLPFKVFRQGRELPGEEQPLQYAATHGTEVRDFELDILQNNGNVTNLFGHAAPLLDENGNPRGAVGAFLDITERKQIQEALTNTNQTLQALIQSCPLAITVFSLEDGRVTMWNPAAEQIFGWSEQEALGHFLPSVPEEKREEFLNNLHVIGEGKTIKGVETRRQKKGGSPIDINLWAAPVRDAKGNVSCMSIVADISERQAALRERKQAEAALRESEERFRKLTEKVRVIPWEADPNTGKFTYVGPQTVEILGYPLDDWYRDDFWPEHIHPDDRDWAIAYCQDNSAVLNNYEFEYRMLAADGRIVWLYDIVNVVRRNGNPSLLRGFMIDITERKQAEEEREQSLVREQIARAEAEQARNTAESANRMKDEFLATLSHELRTPLNAMLGWTQMLRTRTLDDATVARALETIERNTKSLATLIEDVLDVSRIIRGKLHLTTNPIELVPVINAAIDTIRPAAQAKDIQIKSMLNPDVGMVLGDANRLQQVVWNLLSNAVKFTPKGGQVEVQLSVVSGQSSVVNNNNGQHTTDDYIRIQVSDTGKGIAPEFLPYVFERFRQENNSTTRTYGGLGLGLAIVRHLVELHGGTVHADSLGEGRGATFSVYLPRL